MPKTPQEIATLPVNEIETRDWLHDASARDIQAYARAIINKTYAEPDRELARVALQVRISEDNLKAAKALEQHTKSLILLMQSLVEETKVLRKLTVGLLILTVGLLVFTIVLAVRH
jgi:pantoate kinase